jgi:hypothetical protein
VIVGAEDMQFFDFYGMPLAMLIFRLRCRLSGRDSDRRTPRRPNAGLGSPVSARPLSSALSAPTRRKEGVSELFPGNQKKMHPVRRNQGAADRYRNRFRLKLQISAFLSGVRWDASG